MTIKSEKIEIFIVGAQGVGKSILRKALLNNYPNLRVHTVQCDPEELADVTFSDNPIAWDDNS